MMTDGTWSQLAFEEAVRQAELSLTQGGIPIGSSLERAGKIVASGHNQRIQLGDPILHGEMDCLRNAGRQKTYRDTIIYSTLMPCYMCAGTIVQFKIPLVVVGESKTFAGAENLLRSHGIEVIDLADDRCVDLMNKFIEQYPDLWREDISK